MKVAGRVMRLWVAGLVLPVAATGAWGQSNSLFSRAEQESRARSLRSHMGMGPGVGALRGAQTTGMPPGGTLLEAGARGATGAAGAAVSRSMGVRLAMLADPAAGVGRTVYTSAQSASWITVDKPRPKDVRVHDLVTIIVNEVSKNTTKADTKADREYGLDAALKDWIQLTGGNLRPDKQGAGDPKVSLSYKKQFEGKGDIKREDTVTARIQAEVIDVLPNGNLVLESTHQVITDEEETLITLSGICRSKDVGVDNTVLSTQLARLDLQKHHKGIGRDTGKRGLLSGLVDWLAPF